MYRSVCAACIHGNNDSSILRSAKIRGQLYQADADTVDVCRPLPEELTALMLGPDS